MGLTSLQVCMDTSDWLQQGPANEESRVLVDSTSPSSGDNIIAAEQGPMTADRRLRPQHDGQALKCPRCDSTHTKFCYYNNYSLTQPRYFCKTCRRYWTKGGSLRNVPVGGGCRKNKKVPTKKPSHDPSHPNHIINSSPHDATDLHLSSSGGPHFTGLLAGSHANPNFMECKYDSMLGYPRNGDHFMETKLDSMLGINPARSYALMGSNGDSGQMICLDDASHGFTSSHGLLGFTTTSPFGYAMDDNQGTYMGSTHGERMLLPYGGLNNDHHHQDPNAIIEMKPSHKMLSLEWHDQQSCSEVGKDSFGYTNNIGLGSWPGGTMNGYGSSTRNTFI